MTTASIGIVGCGPWGLCVLERILSRARRIDVGDLRIHIIEPGVPGMGVHFRGLPDYLLLNTKCSQVSMFVEDEFGDIPDPIAGPNLLAWAREQGYRMQPDGFGVSIGEGRELAAGDFVPRRLLGEYMHWCYTRLLRSAPGNVTLTHHRESAVDVEPAGTRERIILEGGGEIDVDYAFLTTGHTTNRPRHEPARAAGDQPHFTVEYPLTRCLGGIESGTSIGIEGFGLSAIDVLTELTVGRGGRYVRSDHDGRQTYLPSGREPSIYMFSRSGAPYCALPVATGNASRVERQAEFFTVEQIDALRQLRRCRTGDARLDLFADVLPLLWDEMKLVFYESSARLRTGEKSAQALRKRLVQSWHSGDYAAELRRAASDHGEFDPESFVLRPVPPTLADSDAYQGRIRAMLEDELVEAYKGENASARKCALELFRVLRNTLRYAVDFEGLMPTSRVDFRRRMASAINRVIVGPPAARCEEMLALMNAGVLHIPFGPSPALETRDDGKVTVRSTAFAATYALTLDTVCHAYLGHPSVDRSHSPLLTNLYRRGRLQPFGVNGESLGGAMLDREFHPVDTAGGAQARIFVLGQLAEGIRYFNHYIPSPQSRFQAFRDADACVRAILEPGRNAAETPVTVV